MRRVYPFLVLLVATIQFGPGGQATAAGGSGLSAGTISTDFNADGFQDLAIGVTNESVGTVLNAGAVNVLYGSATGISATANQLWTQDSRNVLEVSEADDQFSHGLVSGDFNADGFTDLAVGAPFEDVGTIGSAGAVNVLYGTANGLSARDQLFTQDSPNVLDQSEASDLFGASLAAGDINGDGFTDLAIGVRQEKVGAAGSAGAVNVLYGSAVGLTTAGNQFWTQDSPGVEGEGAEGGDVFSRGLGVGDFDGDGFADMGVGAWEEDVGAIPNAGAVNVLYGSAAGLTTDGNQYWTQNSPDVQEVAESNDWFGRPVTPGDFNGDGFDDVALGAHLESVGGVNTAGAANVLYGSAAGLTAAGNQLWTQDSPDVEDLAEVGDHFARTAASGDINGDGFADLAVGVSEEDVGVIDSAGAVSILFGSAGGLVATDDEFWTQDSPQVKDVAEEDDLFGWYVKLGDFDGDGSADLASAAAFEDLGAEVDAGAVNLLYGSPDGLTTAGTQIWTQNNVGVKEVAEGGNLFGAITT
jgi:hypothetical protein